jgi:hypothetical protein
MAVAAEGCTGYGVSDFDSVDNKRQNTHIIPPENGGHWNFGDDLSRNSQIPQEIASQLYFKSSGSELSMWRRTWSPGSFANWKINVHSM